MARLPYICVVDSKSLYDMIQKCMNPATQCDDKRTSIDVAPIVLNRVIQWTRIDGRALLADTLTKSQGRKGDYLRHVMLQEPWCIPGAKEFPYSRSFWSGLQTVPMWRPAFQ